MKYLVMLLFMSIVMFVAHNEAIGMCVASNENFYWPNVPCHDAGESIDEQKQDWANFYYFMGSDWMDKKAMEYEALLNNSSLDPYEEWIRDGTNFNVMHQNFAEYYKLFGGEPPHGMEPNPVEIPQTYQYVCNENCAERYREGGKYLCHQEEQGSYLCVQPSHMTTEIRSTQKGNSGQTIFEPREVTVSLEINNTIAWRNYGYVSSVISEGEYFEPISVPFTDLSWLTINKTGKYEFYDHTDPDVRTTIIVKPFDYDFELGKPIEKSTSDPNARYLIFRAPDTHNFVNGIQIVDPQTVTVHLDDTMNPEYEVGKTPSTLTDKEIEIGQQFVSGCTYHHDMYSRLLYLTLERINSESNFAEFKETVEFVSGNRCIGDINAESVRNKVEEGFLPPLKQLESGIPIDKIQCKKEMTLIIKSSDGSPACVTPETKQKLVERGWTTKDDGAVLETERSWRSSSDWNSLELMKNNGTIYCTTMNGQLGDQCYSLEEIVFGDHHKKAEQGWKIYPGGAGWRLPQNSTLTPIYKEVKFGMMPLDFAAMLDDKTFVNKCESGGGTWNYTHHDCEGLVQICDDLGGVYVRDDIAPPHTSGAIDDDSSSIEVWSGQTIRIGCVFPYEN